MLEKILRALFGKKLVIFTRKEFDEMMEPYMYYEKFVRNLCGLEDSLHTSDNAEDIITNALKKACKFYDADWAGFLEIDMVMKVWYPSRWYNTNPRDMTLELMEEFESIDCMKQWLTSLHENRPICIPDVEALKESSPDEYAMYRKLKADSILAVPVCPRPTGFMVIRNPKLHVSEEESGMLRMIAYVMLSNINDQTSNEKLKRTYSPKNIKDPNDVVINMFGELEIYTATGKMTETTLASPAVAKLIVFLYLNKGRNFAARTLVEELFHDREERDIDKDIQALRTQICRSRQLLESVSAKDLITSSQSGYCLSDAFDITTDVQLFDEYFDKAIASSSALDKIEWMKYAVNLYKGDLLTSAYGEKWLITDMRRYHLKYVIAVNTLLQNLADVGAFSQVQYFAEDSLKKAEGNEKAYYWLIVAYNRLGASELTEGILMKAKMELIDDDYKKLKEQLEKEGEI